MFDLAASVLPLIGAYFALLGATIQLGLDLGDRQSYMRRAESLDEAGVEAATPYKIVLGYKYPEKLTWMPRETNEWLQLKTPSMLGWLSVGLGAYILFLAAIAPFVGDGGYFRKSVVLIVALLALLPALLVYGVVTAGAARPGRERAEAEWRAKHSGQQLPKDPERRFNDKLERCHDRLLGRTSQ